jgi:hypothetical protein
LIKQRGTPNFNFISITAQSQAKNNQQQYGILKAQAK